MNKAAIGFRLKLFIFSCMVGMFVDNVLLPSNLDSMISVVSTVKLCGIDVHQPKDTIVHQLREMSKQVHPDKVDMAQVFGCDVQHIATALKESRSLNYFSVFAIFCIEMGIKNRKMLRMLISFALVMIFSLVLKSIQWFTPTENVPKKKSVLLYNPGGVLNILLRKLLPWEDIEHEYQKELTSNDQSELSEKLQKRLCRAPGILELILHDPHAVYNILNKSGLWDNLPREHQDEIQTGCRNKHYYQMSSTLQKKVYNNAALLPELFMFDDRMTLIKILKNSGVWNKLKPEEKDELQAETQKISITPAGSPVEIFEVSPSLKIRLYEIRDKFLFVGSPRYGQQDVSPQAEQPHSGPYGSDTSSISGLTRRPVQNTNLGYVTFFTIVSLLCCSCSDAARVNTRSVAPLMTHSRFNFRQPPCTDHCGREPHECIDSGWVTDDKYIFWYDQDERACRCVVINLPKQWLHTMRGNFVLSFFAALLDGFQWKDLLSSFYAGYIYAQEEQMYQEYDNIKEKLIAGYIASSSLYSDVEEVASELASESLDKASKLASKYKEKYAKKAVGGQEEL